MANIQQENVSEFSLRDVFTIVFKHKYKMILCFVVIVTLVTAVTFLMQRTYTSSAKLFVQAGRRATSMDTADSPREKYQVVQSMENQMNSEIEIIKSMETLKEVVRRIGIEAFLGEDPAYETEKDSPIGRIRQKVRNAMAFPKEAIAGFIESISGGGGDGSRIDLITTQIVESFDVSVVSKSHIINLSYSTHNKKLARDVVQETVNVYLDRRQKLHGTPQSYDFFRKESDSFKAKLEAAEEKLTAFKNRMNVGSIDEQQQILSQQIGDLNQKLKETKSDIESLQMIDGPAAGADEEQNAFLVPDELIGFESQAMADMREKIYDLKLKEQELMATYKETSVPVMEINRQIRDAQQLFREAKKRALEGLKNQQESLQNQLESANRELTNLNEAEFKLRQLEREKDQLTKKYETYADSLEQTRIDRALELENISNVKIAQAPNLPAEPSSPKTTINLILGFLVAVFGSLGLPFLLEYFDNSFQRPEQIEDALNIPVLGSIEKMKK